MANRNIFANFGVEISLLMEIRSKSNEILTTTQESCNILVGNLISYGVKHAIVSPGSRNAPIIIALSQRDEIEKYIIVDERSAAFTAIGIAQHSQSPVAIVCTSGSAVLNYAPGIAEAYYQQLPIIVISADRPIEWINQNDSQTIHQKGILNNIVKGSYDIPADCSNQTILWYCNRTINEALQTATALPNGPVHINIQLNEPLYNCKPLDEQHSRTIQRYVPKIDAKSLSQFIEKINTTKKVLILASFHNDCNDLSDSLNNISGGNIVVLSEIVANNHGKKIFYNIDRLFTEINDSDWAQLQPDILISYGGAPVSRLAKTLLRKCEGIEHWRIGNENSVIDTFQNLTLNIEISPSIFFNIISKEVRCIGEYYNAWQSISNKANASHSYYIDNAPWSDLKAMNIIMNQIPTSDINIQISNGSAIRYADILGKPANFSGSYHCNRGVSGIDGSTSTALGASMISTSTTLLITGDMSFSYDLSGLASQYNSERFKIIVLCNGGGGIFRFINGPSNLPEFERYFEVHRNIPVNKYAEAFGFDYFEADNEQALTQSFNAFINNDKASILAVYTDNKISADTLKGYFSRNKLQ